MALTARRLIGAALLVGAYVPLHRLLDPSRAGPAGEATRASADAAWAVGLYGTLLVVGAALALTLLVPTTGLGRAAEAVAEALTRPSKGWFAACVGLTAGGLSLCVAVLLFERMPTSVDEMAQLLHAQALAHGMLGVPLPGPQSAWTIQNGLMTPRGWASIYPPFHTLLLALGLRLGAPVLVGPVAVGVATWASALSFEELLGGRTGRAAALVLAVCPFWLLLGATHLSHTTAAAAIAVVLWTGLRARSGGLGWALAAGAAMGAAVTARPWIGLVSSATLLAVVWWGHRERLPARVGALIAGGAPFAALLAWWNSRLFGGPLRLGYSAAYGSPHALGLHVDPWGNIYGIREAVAYTGADLVQLGAHLLETPLPATALVGVALVVGLRGHATRPFLAWATTAVLANALYWHHGVHMGPRMLYEAVPAWIALFAAAAAYLTGQAVTPGRPRRVAAWSVATAAVGALVLIPGVLSSVSRSSEDLAFATLPVPPTDEPALVFVHGSWSSRVVARLAAAGMRRDSIETALRRNDICAVDRYARWRASEAPDQAAGRPALDLQALPGTPAGLTRTRVSPGNEVWTEPGAPLDDPCARDARADARGTVDLEPLLWQAPPLGGRHLIVARDMGPDTNALVRAASAGRTAYVFAPTEAGEAPVLMEYDEGMRLLWGTPRPPGL